MTPAAADVALLKSNLNPDEVWARMVEEGRKGKAG
jgi:hypothetical protein